MSGTLGKVFRVSREELGKGNRDYSVRKVAKKAGISATYLSQLERGIISSPSENVIRNLAAILDLNAEDLILKTGQVSSELGDAIRSRPEELTDVLMKLNNMPKKDLALAVKELRATVYEWLPEVLGMDSPNDDAEKLTRVATVTNQKVSPPNSPGPKETAHWGKEMTRSLLECRGYNVQDHPDFPSNSNALLIDGKCFYQEKKIQFTVFPKTSKSTRQIRLGSEKFVSERNAQEVYFAFIPKDRQSSVFTEYQLFILPAQIAATDGLLANDVYVKRGGKPAGIIIKDIEREPHKSIWSRWERCFHEGWDWLPRIG